MSVMLLFFFSTQTVRPQKKATKGGRKKKVTLRFVLDCTHPCEDNILDVADFVSPVVYVFQCYLSLILPAVYVRVTFPNTCSPLTFSYFC